MSTLIARTTQSIATAFTGFQIRGLRITGNQLHAFRAGLDLE